MGTGTVAPLPARSKSVSREPFIHVPVYRQLVPIELPAVSTTKKQKNAVGKLGFVQGEADYAGKEILLATAIFGTDINRIQRVVQMIGGGPVKQPAEVMVSGFMDLK